VIPLDAGGLLDALHRNDVRFVVIGGLAVGIHGHMRTTLDLDIVPDPASDNIARLVAMLTQIDATVRSKDRFDPARHERPLRRGANATLTTRHGGLDIVQRIDGVPSYDDLARRSVEASLDGFVVKVTSLRDLRAMKEAAGRPQDLDDLANLPLIDES